MTICVPRPDPPSLPGPPRANGMPANGVPQTGCLRLRDIFAERDILTNLDSFCDHTDILPVRIFIGLIQVHKTDHRPNYWVSLTRIL